MDDSSDGVVPRRDTPPPGWAPPDVPARAASLPAVPPPLGTPPAPAGPQPAGPQPPVGPPSVELPPVGPPLPPWPPVPGRAAGRRRWRAPWVRRAAVAALAVTALVAGLLLWAPWRPPSAPRALTAKGASPTAVTLSWSAPSEGDVERYLVVRDGAEVGSVPAARTSYRDERLVPGAQHRYRVVAARGSARSPASAEVSARASAPSPSGLASKGVDTSSVALTWTPPAEGPPPDQYVVLVDGKPKDVIGAPVSGRPTTRVVGLVHGTTYSVQVEAVWSGGGVSEPSAVMAVVTRDPPLAEARLDGTAGVPVAFKVTATSSADVKAGAAFTNTWTLTPSCDSGPCDVRLQGSFHPSGSGAPFELTLRRAGAGYSGSGAAVLSTCSGRDMRGTVTVRITITEAAGADWTATRWSGTFQYSTPYTSAGGAYYCPAGRSTAAISSSSDVGV